MGRTRFDRRIRRLSKESNLRISRFSPKAVRELQRHDASKNKIIELLRMTEICVIHSNRMTARDGDVELACRILGIA